VLGEGLGFVGLGVLVAVTVARMWRLGLRPSLGPTGAGVLSALGVWLGAGIVAWVLGGEGALRARELGRWGRWCSCPWSTSRHA